MVGSLTMIKIQYGHLILGFLYYSIAVPCATVKLTGGVHFWIKSFRQFIMNISFTLTRYSSPIYPSSPRQDLDPSQIPPAPVHKCNSNAMTQSSCSAQAAPGAPHNSSVIILSPHPGLNYMWKPRAAPQLVIVHALTLHGTMARVHRRHRGAAALTISNFMFQILPREMRLGTKGVAGV